MLRIARSVAIPIIISDQSNDWFRFAIHILRADHIRHSTVMSAPTCFRLIGVVILRRMEISVSVFVFEQRVLNGNALAASRSFNCTLCWLRHEAPLTRIQRCFLSLPHRIDENIRPTTELDLKVKPSEISACYLSTNTEAC